MSLFAGGAFVACSSSDSGDDSEERKPESTKKERNLLREGNSEYRDEHYNESLDAYLKAYNENPESELAQFNYASALYRQAPNSENVDSIYAQADSIMSTLSSGALDRQVREAANYDLGNRMYRKESYREAIEFYKGALRMNPDNDAARENLRLAQLKINDDNQDQQQQQNQDQNQDQQQQDQQPQQQQPQQQQPQEKNQQQNEQNRQALSKENMDNILKTVEAADKRTRKEMEQKEARKAAPSSTSKPW